MIDVFFYFFTAFSVYLFFIFSLRSAYGLSLSSPGPFGYVAFVEAPFFLIFASAFVSAGFFDDSYITDFITQDGKVTSFLWIMYSFVGLSVSNLIIGRRGGKDSDIDHSSTNLTSWILLLFSLFCLAFVLVTASSIPILFALKGEYLEAAVARSDFLWNRTGFSSYFTAIFPKYIIILSLIFSIINRRNIRYWRINIAFNILSALIFSVWDIQKAVLISYIIICFFASREGKHHKGVVIKYLILGVSVLAGVVVIYMVSKGNDNLSFSHPAIARVFAAQIAGFYQIVQLIHPDFKYMLNSFPLIKNFDVLSVDVQREIMLLTEGYSETAGVKNTIFTGEAYAMGGVVMMLVSPIVVCVYYLIAYSVIAFFLPANMRLASRYVLVYLSPLSLSYANFLYLKGILFFIVAVIPVLILLRFFRIFRGINVNCCDS